MGFRSIELKAPAMEAERASEIEIREKEREWVGFRDRTNVGGGGDASLKLCHGGHELWLRERERERTRLKKYEAWVGFLSIFMPPPYWY